MLFPCLTSFVLILLYWKFIATRKEPKSPDWRLIYDLCKQIRLRYDSFRSTILMPVVMALFAFMVLTLLALIFHQNYIVGFGFPTILALFISGVLAPINEEIAFRGLIFWVQGITLATILWNFTDRLKKRNNYEGYPPVSANGVYVMLVVQALIFSFIHFDASWVIFLFKVMMGLIAGCLFYFNNKNLLPAMIFHGVSNAMVILVAGQPLF